MTAPTPQNHTGAERFHELTTTSLPLGVRKALGALVLPSPTPSTVRVGRTSSPLGPTGVAQQPALRPVRNKAPYVVVGMPTRLPGRGLDVGQRPAEPIPVTGPRPAVHDRSRGLSAGAASPGPSPSEHRSGAPPVEHRRPRQTTAMLGRPRPLRHGDGAAPRAATPPGSRGNNRTAPDRAATANPRRHPAPPATWRSPTSAGRPRNQDTRRWPVPPDLTGSDRDTTRSSWPRASTLEARQVEAARLRTVAPGAPLRRVRARPIGDPRRPAADRRTRTRLTSAADALELLARGRHRLQHRGVLVHRLARGAGADHRPRRPARAGRDNHRPSSDGDGAAASSTPRPDEPRRC